MLTPIGSSQTEITHQQLEGHIYTSCPPFFLPLRFRSLKKLQVSLPVSLGCMLLSDQSPHLPSLTNRPNRGCWGCWGEAVAAISCDVLLFPVVLCVCIQPNIKIYIFCLYPSCDSN